MQQIKLSTTTSVWPWRLLLLVATGVCYSRVVYFDFISLDDPPLILDNPFIQQGFSLEILRWALGTDVPVGWNPLAWLSHILDWQLFGAFPGGHHGVNVLLHLGNVMLLFELLRKMTGALLRSVAVAGLFAIHPLHVESVAWVAERRDVLCMFWMLVSLHAYVAYGRQSTWSRYTLVLMSFMLALMSKPLAVTLPCVMLLIDYWPMDRLRSNTRLCVLEKLPMLAMSSLASWLTILIHDKLGAFAQLDNMSRTFRIQNGLVSYGRYIVKMVCPNDLAVMYPIPPSYPTWQVAAAGGLLVVVSICAVYWRKKRPYLLMGWLWFMGVLVPMSGLMQVGTQSMADRFTYLPMIGLYIAIVWGIGDLVSSKRIPQRLIAPVAGLIFSLLWVLSFIQVGYWANSITLFDHAVHVTKNNTMAMHSLGIALAKRNAPGDMDRAIELYQRVLAIDPSDSFALRSLGGTLILQGREDQAAPHLLKLGRQYAQLGKKDHDRPMLMLAVRYYQWSLKCSPNQQAARVELKQLTEYLRKQNNVHE